MRGLEVAMEALVIGGQAELLNNGFVAVHSFLLCRFAFRFAFRPVERLGFTLSFILSL
jgi:hypothetical protein